MKQMFTWKVLRLLLLMAVPTIALLLGGVWLSTLPAWFVLGKIMIYVAIAIGVSISLWSPPVIRWYFNKYGWPTW